jgi:indolepyruvate ferredoxin oxidoreductase
MTSGPVQRLRVDDRRAADGDLTVKKVIDIAREGGRHIVVVADPTRYREVARRHPGAAPQRLDDVQRELREFKRRPVLVYDRACATEMRRQRRDPPSTSPRTWIHPRNARAAAIAASSPTACRSSRRPARPQAPHQPVGVQQGFLLRAGFCPSFVCRARRAAAAQGAAVGRGRRSASVPALPAVEGFNVVLAGIGGTGIVVGAMLAQAAPPRRPARGRTRPDRDGAEYGDVAPALHAGGLPSRLAEGEADTDRLRPDRQRRREALAKMAPAALSR